MTKTPRTIRSQRLYLRAPLAQGARIALEPAQANYLVNVLRLPLGGTVRVFNGRDGEWQASLSVEKRKTCHLVIDSPTRPQGQAPDLHFIFAPLKQARLDFAVEKAVEMGASRLRPVLVQHGQVRRINTDRLRQHAIEAAEQCGLLSVPPIDEPVSLKALLAGWDEQEMDRCIVFCDEAATGADPVAILSAIDAVTLAVLIGPEGGFSNDERRLLRSLPFVVAIPLGPRILRADTAAVAALALVQAVLGDWRTAPPPSCS